MKRVNTIISIGYLGCKRCYMNVGMDEAISRYMASENISEPPPEHIISTTEVTDEWMSYDGAWENE